MFSLFTRKVSPHIQAAVDLLEQDPGGWSDGDCTVHHKGTVAIWVANGLLSVRLYSGAGALLGATLYDKIFLRRAIRNWLAWKIALKRPSNK